MITNHHLIWLPVGLSLLVACASQPEYTLIGDWRVERLIEAEQEVHFDELQEVRFSFCEDGQYTFSGTLNYREAGRYERRGNFLHTTDTLHTTQQEKRVKIVTSEADFLELHMKKGDVDRVLELVKIDSIKTVHGQ